MASRDSDRLSYFNRYSKIPERFSHPFSGTFYMCNRLNNRIGLLFNTCHRLILFYRVCDLPVSVGVFVVLLSSSGCFNFSRSFRPFRRFRQLKLGEDGFPGNSLFSV